MHVGIVETGQRHAAREVDDPGLRADQRFDVPVRTDGDEHAVKYGRSLSPASLRIDGIDAAIQEREFSRRRGGSLRTRLRARALAAGGQREQQQAEEPSTTLPEGRGPAPFQPA